MNDQLLLDLREALERLADAVAHRPPLSATLRRLAGELPEPRRELTISRRGRDTREVQPLLWEALADGVLDARRFDVAMVAGARAARDFAAPRLNQ